MTHYYLRSDRHEKARRIKIVVLVVVIVTIAVLWLNWSAGQDAKIMDIDYCWDSTGQHYVMPNINCWNYVP